MTHISILRPIIAIALLGSVVESGSRLLQQDKLNGRPYCRLGDCTCDPVVSALDSARGDGRTAAEFDRTNAALAADSAKDDDLLLADFEGEMYGDWKTTGEAFGPGPARGTLPNQMPVSGFLGKGLVNSYFNGDGTTGTLTSPAFKIERRYLNFLIGGGKHEGETCINLRVDGRLVRTASGPNDKPGGSEQLEWHTWDVTEFAGKQAVIEIVDRHTGGWGHINVDQIVQSATKRQPEPAARRLNVRSRYLNFPVKTGAPQRRLRIVASESRGGKDVVPVKIFREFDIELAEEKPDFWVFLDVSDLQNKSASIEFDALPAGSKALDAIVEADAPKTETPFYAERHRPQFHFTSRRGWLNDPNGLVFDGKEYHLFYQHNPYGWNWGNMHWGHAVSGDLVHWRELGDAVAPRQYGDWAFSGSAVLDAANTSGLGTTAAPPLIAAFTSTGRGECILFSRDSGLTWNELPENPVLKHAGRDPRLLWHAPTKSWIMAVYDEQEGKKWIALYGSQDFRKWEFLSRLEDFFECPDLLELAIEGTTERRWILYAADGRYLIGEFDGRTFRPESEKQQVWYGNFYAAQTFSNAPRDRHIQIGWANGVTFPGMPFNQQMTVPCELRLRRTNDGLRLCVEPVAELESLRAKRRQWTNLEAPVASKTLEEVSGDLFEIDTELLPGDSEAVGFTIRGIPLEYDARKHELRCRDKIAPVKPEDGRLRLRILVDRASIEVFANGGRAALSVGVIPPDDNTTLAVYSRDGAARFTRLAVHELRSTWQTAK